MTPDAPPPPDKTHVPAYRTYEEVAEVLYGAGDLRRAIITRDAAGLFRVRFEEWDTAGWENGEPIHWIPASRASLTDTLGQARKLARGRVRQLTGSDR